MSKVSLCNAALSKIGEKSIMAITDDNERASVCNDRYDDVLKQLLRSHPWNFATKRQSLARLSTTPEFEFTYEYQLPSDCLRVIDINPDTGLSADYIYGYGSLSNVPYDTRPVFRIEGRKILTDIDEVNLVYIAFIEDPDQYDEGFKDAFTCKLAAEICMRLTQSRELRKELMQEYISMLKIAKSQDASEDTPKSLYGDQFLIFSRR